jgi:hypothetical protein
MKFIFGVLFFTAYYIFLRFFAESIIKFKVKSWKYWIGITGVAIFFSFYKKYIN